MSLYSSAVSDDMPSLLRLSAKYEAVLAENEQLYHDLQVEQTQRVRFESAYRRVQQDMHKDQAILHRLYAQSDRHVPEGERPVTRESRGDAGDSPPSRDVNHSGYPAPHTTSESDRVRALERDCAYLQAKVESLSTVIQRYERGNEADAAGVAASPPLPATQQTAPVRSSQPEASAVAELEAAREGRRRAEEQLTRYHATLQRLRDDAAKKEFFFQQQLAALEAQNAALLEDLDRWVTAQQRGYVATAVAPRRPGGGGQLEGEGTDLAGEPSIPHRNGPTQPVREAPPHPLGSADELQQLLSDHEAVLAVKEKSIAQLERRVAELESQLHQAEREAGPPRHAQSPGSPSSHVLVPSGDLHQLHVDTAAAQSCLARFAGERLSNLSSTPLSPPGDSWLRDGWTREQSAAQVVDDAHRVLRHTVEVLHEERRCRPPAHDGDRLRMPPSTVLQPSAAQLSYRSGETLSEAAQQLAQLMRRHVH